MSKSTIDFLHHILDECEYLTKAIHAPKLTKENFIKDETLTRAAARSIEIIGEASKNIPAEFREKYTDIEWKKLAGMRNHLIHNYMGVNYNIVWDVIKNKIPELKNEIEKIIEKEQS